MIKRSEASDLKQAQRIKEFAAKHNFEYCEKRAFEVGVNVIFSGLIEWVNLSAIDESHFLEVVISDIFEKGKTTGKSDMRTEFRKLFGIQAS